MVTNNFTVQLCRNVGQNYRPCYFEDTEGIGNIKAVQTSFSSVDLTTAEKYHSRRKIKPQEDLRKKKRLQSDVTDWLKEIYPSESTAKFWGQKMQRLALKLTKPGGEEKIRQKIQKYLNRVPGKFSECDKDIKEFREQLPDNIIRKLKTVYLKPEKKKKFQTSPVRVLRIEVPKYENESQENIDLKSLVDKWMKDVPLKKRDFFGRIIKKDDVLMTIVEQLDPYLRHVQNLDNEHTTSIILNILKDMPIDIDDNNKNSYFNILATSLTNELFHVHAIKYHDAFEECQNEEHRLNLNENHLDVSSKVKTFIKNEIANIINKLDLNMSTNRLELLEEELNDALIEVIDKKEGDIGFDSKENILIILCNLAGLSNYQANYFTDVVIKHFNEDILDKRAHRIKQVNVLRSNSMTTTQFKKTYSVFQSVPKISSNVSTSNEKANVDSKQEKICLRKYEDVIDDWLDSIFIVLYGKVLQFQNRNAYVHDLATKALELIKSKRLEVDNDKSCYFKSIALEWYENLPLPRGPDKNRSINNFLFTLAESLLDNEENKTKINPYQSKANVSQMQNRKETTLKVDVENSVSAKNVFTEENKGTITNISVYDVTLANTTDASIKGINKNDIEASLQLYSKQLVQQIDEWLSFLQIPQINDSGFRKIVVNDLAGDIIDRHKYLELNPSSRGSDEHELEQLKYQIFKWINKLVGEDEQETISRAAELMKRIQSIPAPMLINETEYENKPSSSGNKYKYSTKNMSISSHQSNRNGNISSEDQTMSNRVPSPTKVRLSSPLGFTTGPMATSKEKRLSTTQNTDTLKKLPIEESDNLPPGMSLDDVYAHYDAVFQNRIQEIPLETPTPEQEMLADLARKGMYNGIWKTYFQLKADPDIEDDYSLFEMLFEEQINSILDCLPQTEEIIKIRQGWKSKLMFDVMNMLKYVHSITDTPSFRQKLTEKFDRQFIRKEQKEGSNLLQHDFVARTADAYILYSKYKEQDPIKANIYRQRLMKRIEELADAVKTQNKVDFRFINQAQLCQMAMQLLESVPIPNEDVLKEEAEEILVSEEIEQWYKSLPVRPIINKTDEVLRKRLRELLAKKLCDIEKGTDINNSDVEINVKHEISKFLHEKAALKQNEDLNINFLVEELTNRLKNRREHEMVGYETFEREKPVSSSFVQTDPGEVMAPLVDIGENQDQSMIRVQPGQGHVSQVASPSSQGYPSQNRISIPEDTNFVRPYDNDDNFVRPPSRPRDRSSILKGMVDKTDVPIEPNHYMNHFAPDDRRRSSGAMNRSYNPRYLEIRPRGNSFVQTDQNVYGNQRSNRKSAEMAQPQSQADLDLHRNGIHSSNIQEGNGVESRQAFGQEYLSVPQGPSTGFVSSRSGVTRSTARMASPVDPEEEDLTDDEVRVKCRCMERIWKCKKRHYYDGMPPRCFPMPFPCRHYF